MFLCEDGALCLRRNASGHVIWSQGKKSGTNASKLAVNHDCRLVVYDTSNSVIWSHGERTFHNEVRTELKVLDDGRLEMKSTKNSYGASFELFNGGYSILEEPISAIEADQATTIGQTLTSGNFEMGFNTYGSIFVRDKEKTTITYYYVSDRSPEGVVVLQITRDGYLEFFDEMGVCRSRSRNSGAYGHSKYPKTKLSLTPDGRVVLRNCDKDRWDSKTERLSGPEPIMPPGLCYGFCLLGGQSLLPGQWIMSPNGEYYLINQTNGNVVLRSRIEAEKPNFDHGWLGPPEPGKLTLHENGRLVKYGKDGKTVEFDNELTRGGGDAKLVVRNDGTFAILLDDVPFWQTSVR